MSGLGTAMAPGGIVGASGQPVPQDTQTIPTNPSEISHTSSVETLGFLLNRDFIFMDRFTIDVTMNPGFVFGVIRIHPQDAHMYIRQVYAMFNAWTGSVGIRARFMGTAFYGGSFRVGFLPPNISEAQIRGMTVQALTAYPNVDLDPKNTDWMYYSPPDERNVMYHWSAPPDSTKPETFGGYIVFYVVGPLVTQNDAFRSISMIVEMQGKYMFAQPNPTFGSSIQPPVLPGPLTDRSLLNVLSQDGCDDHLNANTVIQILNKSIVSLGVGLVYGYGYNKTNPGTYAGSAISVAQSNNRTNVLDGSIKILPACTVTTNTDSSTYLDVTPQPGYKSVLPTNAEKSSYACVDALFAATPAANGPQVVNNATRVSFHEGEPFKIFWQKGVNASGYCVSYDAGKVTTLTLASIDSTTPLSVANIGDTTDITKYVPLPAGESIVTFCNLGTRTMNLQTRQMAQDLAATTGMDVTQSYIYSLRAVDLPSPIRLLRLSANGMFTTNAVDADVLISRDVEMYLVYEQTLPVNTPLPPQTEFQYYMERKYEKDTSRIVKKMKALKA